MFEKFSKVLLTSGMLVLFISVAMFAQEQKKPIEKKISDHHAKCTDNHSKCSDTTKYDSKTAGIAEDKIWNKVCPVMGEDVDRKVQTIEYKGKTIGFCCKGCMTKFKKDPEKYMKNLSEDGTKFSKSE